LRVGFDCAPEHLIGPLVLVSGVGEEVRVAHKACRVCPGPRGSRVRACPPHGRAPRERWPETRRRRSCCQRCSDRPHSRLVQVRGMARIPGLEELRVHDEADRPASARTAPSYMTSASAGSDRTSARNIAKLSKAKARLGSAAMAHRNIASARSTSASGP
jgi:hypothetical protein